MIDRVLRPWFDITAIALLIIIVAPREPSLTDRFLVTQDLPVLAGILIVAIGLRFMPGLAWALGWVGRALGRGSLGAARLTGVAGEAASIGLALICGVIAFAGARLVYEGYALSLDEFMARFDAAIIARGQLMAPVAPAWRPYLSALQPIFVNPIGGGADWASVYLPVNAVMRGLAMRIGAEPLVSPALAAVSVLAVHAVARKLWPARPLTQPDACLIVRIRSAQRCARVKAGRVFLRSLAPRPAAPALLRNALDSRRLQSPATRSPKWSGRMSFAFSGRPGA